MQTPVEYKQHNDRVNAVREELVEESIANGADAQTLIREALATKWATRDGLTAYCDVTPRTFYAWEHGQSTPRPRKMLALRYAWATAKIVEAQQF